MTPYQLHIQNWKEGCGSTECPPQARRVVLARGKIPCDVLFIGEAPGESENTIGQPFIGPAGKLLDRIVLKALGASPLVRVAFTNLVGCIPREEGGTKKATEPTDEQVKCCTPRLQDIVRIANPKLIVCVGKWPQNMLMDHYSRDRIKFHKAIRMVHITHPAAILRANVTQQGLMEQRCVIDVKRAVEDIFLLHRPA